MGFIIFFIFILGLLVGSFLNVAIFRVHEGSSVVRGRSKCMNCEVPIGPKDLVPVFSYFVLRGRCRSCKSVISWQYPAIELVTALLFVVAYLLAPSTEIFIRNAIFIAYLIIIFVYDLRHMLIIDKFTVPAMIVAILLNLWLGVIPAWSILFGGLVLAAFFHLQFKISRGRWVGGGDIRMGALMGFMLGLEYGLVALFIAYVIGALFGVGLMITGKAHRKTPIPFGVFLSLATITMLFYGQEIIQWYLGLFY
jgi:prepilin signal peptidase PulO-like enzyme (type II secretory pathway)